MTNKKLGRILIALGALLLAAAVSLVLYNKHTDKEAREAADKTLVIVKEYTEKHTATVSSQTDQSESSASSSDSQPAGPDEEPVPLDIDGTLYIGIVSLPKLGIELPVTEGWDYVKMKTAACAYSGSIKGRDLIICAHNYSSYFLDLEKLKEGDEVIFTELNGRVHNYRVGWEELISGVDAETLRSGSDSWDLTLFTCTWSGYSRVTLRCIEETER